MPFTPGRPMGARNHPGKPFAGRDTPGPDTGCPEVAPRCQDCPLARCKYDDWRAYRSWKMGLVLATLVTRYPRSITRAEADEEAQRLGVTSRTIFRRLARQREATCPD